MMSPIRRLGSVAILALPLVATFSLHGCNSPLAPPDPIVDEDTVTNDNEGLTGRRLQGSRSLPVSEIMRAIEADRCAQIEGCR